MTHRYCITKWCRSITDSGRDEYTHRFPKMKAALEADSYDVSRVIIYDFRLLDDDGVIYAYGKTTNNNSFAPLDKYGPLYGCTEIQIRNPYTGKYETL